MLFASLCVTFSLQCSVTCGMGQQNRQVECRDIQGESRDNCPDTRPKSIQLCKKPCGDWTKRIDTESKFLYLDVYGQERFYAVNLTQMDHQAQGLETFNSGVNAKNISVSFVIFFFLFNQ